MMDEFGVTDDPGWAPIPDVPARVAEAFVGTCDAGDCDFITSAVVWFDGEGRWLSCCYGHAIKEMARPFLPE